MIRFVLRLLAYVAIAAGFVTLVIDGARSIANSALQYTRISDVLTALMRDRYLTLQPTIERQIHPLLWDPVVVNLLPAPAALVALLVGFLLLRLGAAPRPEIGIVTRR